MEIERLHFSVRTYNCLKRKGIHTVEQLEKMSDDELMSIRGFGVGCLADVRWQIEKPPMTNFDRVMSMNYEKFAEFIMLSPEMEFGVCECCEAFIGHGSDTPCGTENGLCEAELRCNAFKKWLQQPAEDAL